MATKDYTLSELLAEHYLSIGANGRDIIVSILDDLRTGAVMETVRDIGDSETDALNELTNIIVSIVQGNHLDDTRSGDGYWMNPWGRESYGVI